MLSGAFVVICCVGCLWVTGVLRVALWSSARKEQSLGFSFLLFCFVCRLFLSHLVRGAGCDGSSLKLLIYFAFMIFALSTALLYV